MPHFGAPLDIPLYLSGNFAELRTNHFHTGIDIKTQGVEGFPVLAAEDGVVSRIGVSPWGYGNVLYIAHPNGYTTVYGHMQSFSEKITSVVRKEQYTKESFSVDFGPEERVEVKKGEVIGLSGNSGGSGGPHLHFEIRDSKTQRAQNPLLYGFDIKDNIPPRIRGLRVYPMSDTSFVNGTQEPKSFVVHGSSGNYHLKAGTAVSTYGPIAFSVHTIDYLNDQPNKCGVYSLDLVLDGDTVCAQRFDEIDFATSKQINTYKDYDAYHSHRWHYHKSFKSPGNELEIYRRTPQNAGVVNPSSGVHSGIYNSVDAYGNTSVLNFEFQVEETMPGTPVKSEFDVLFTWSTENEFAYQDEFELDIPKNALYEDLPFNFSRQMQKPEMFSPVYLAHNALVPLQFSATYRIKVNAPILVKPSQIIAVRESASGGKSFISGKADGDWFEFKSKYFGKYYLSTDTVPPTLWAWKNSRSGPVNGKSKIHFKIQDDRSGVDSYNGYLNGEWVLLQYDPKKKHLWLDLTEIDLAKGENELKVVIKDRGENEVSQTYKYTY